MRQTYSIILCLAAVTLTYGYHKFQQRIPNGDSVPHPCGTGIWPGVGHFREGGGGPRNQFGLDFAAAGFQWTVALCQADSDDDNVSNGEELGDPHCHWTNGSQPQRAAKSHPGYCDLNTDECRLKNAHFQCHI